VECYNPEQDEWLQRAPMVERRYRPGVAVINNKIYVCGGEEGWDRLVHVYRVAMVTDCFIDCS